MEKAKKQYFIQNTAGVSFAEFFWGLGFPVLIESTFLQIFLKDLGASSFLIGLVPAILMAGISLFPLVSSYAVRNRASQKHLVLGLHLVSSGAVITFGLFLLFTRNPSLVLPAFFISYTLFSACLGLTFPVWLNFLVKIFPKNKSVKGLSLMYLSQNLAKILAAALLVKSVKTFSLSPGSAAWIFLGSGTAFFIGSMGFIFTRELPEKKESPAGERGFFRHTKKIVLDISGNKNLVRYLIGDLDNVIVITAMAFYANYAVQYFNTPVHTAAGLFVCFIYAGSILANLVLGTMDVLTMKNKFISTKIACMALLVLLVFYPGLPAFLAASLLMGFCRGTRSIIYSPMVKLLSGKDDATAYFAAIPLMTIVFSSGFPLALGRLMDAMAGDHGVDSYKIMFGLCFICTAATLVFACRTHFCSPVKTTP